MVDKTVIIRPPDDERRGRRRRPVPADVSPAKVQQRSAGAGENRSKAREAKAAAPSATDKEIAAPHVSPPRKTIGLAGLSLIAAALLLSGVSTALLTVYLLLPPNTERDSAVHDFNAAELDQQIVPVADETTIDSDVALIESVIEPQMVELSGDPVLVKEVQGKARQLLKLEHRTALSAAAKLGVKGAVFRMTDMLDSNNLGLAGGVVGSQQDFAFFQNAAFRPTESELSTANAAADEEEGTSVLAFERMATGRSRNEYARVLKSAAGLGDVLAEFGLDTETSKSAAAAMKQYYGVTALQLDDSVAVLGADAEGSSAQIPVQVSVYRDGEWLGTVAMNDQGSYTKGEDPWHNRDIFGARLLPDEDTEGSRLRLLDAIYAVALRNGLPAAVAGETIMLLSRAHDLEQIVSKGDSITLVYSPDARDPGTGFGRVIYIRISGAGGGFECYVFQPRGGGQFECITSNGDSNIAEAGMVMPVNGTLVAKFGPQKASDGEPRMNFGVDWAAPKGTPVVAAFAGTVTAAGSEPDKGNVVQLSHADGASTTYSYLQRFAPGIAAGAKVIAGQTIGFVGNPPFSREPRLHFELRRNGEPVDPVGEMQASIGKGGAVDVFVQRIIHIESANRCDARNPLSTAVGLGQFIESTWMTTIRVHRPDLLAGRSRAEVLALRTNCELSRAMTAAFTRDNAAVLRSRGHAVTPGNLYLAHFLGVGGAIKALSSHPDRQIVEVFGPAHVNANPFERGKSIGYLISWASRKMAGAGRVAVAATSGKAPRAGEAIGKELPAQTSAPEDRMVRYAGDPVFAELKQNIDVLLR
jgi:hypothetical protein